MKMKTTKFLVAICALALTGVGYAGIKYWDNQTFKAHDVGDYVQDGLVLNYDGIRNAGPNADHDPYATTWVNCKTPGTYDMTRYSLVNSAWVADGSKGTWTSNGFVFGKDAVFHEMTSLTIPTTYTIQTLADVTPGDQGGVAYVMCDYNANNWAACSFALRTSSGGGTPANSVYLVSSTRPYFTTASSSIPFTYATAIHNNAEGVVFAGITAPWNATDGSYRSDLTPGPYTRGNGISLGGHYPTSNELLKGTLKNFRFYSKCLSDEEVAWNRVVDEARYFGRRMALPVTNVVVASNIPIVTGDEPVGCYAVDAGGYTFSAPASRIIKGRTYTLDGFTIETWNGSAWGVPVQHTGETSYAATDAALVRLTWQWTPGDGLVQYDADDYVQDGLVLHYDGIRNAGLGVAHDSTATTWANLGTGGVTYDMVKGGSSTSSAWGDDGFVFAGDAYFKSASKQVLPEYYEIQTLVDAKASDATGIGYIYTRVFADTWNSSDTAWQASSIAIRPAWSQTISGTSYKGHLVFNTHFYTAFRPVVTTDTTVFDYITTFGDSTSASLFTGLEAPTGVPGRAGPNASYSSSPWAARNASYIYLGGHDNGSGVGETLTGTIKSFRYYSRILSADERAWNRAVDEARYFTEPNVVVASTRSDVQANEPDGDYRVSGSYTFTAPASVTIGNVTYEPSGYAIQTWDDVNGVWGAATEYTGASYAYTTAAGKVRLLWRWQAVRGIRAAADYDVSDYVAGGLTFHLDGIRTVGADVGHEEAPATWVNLGTAGAAANANIRSGDAARVVNWTGKGYRFDGNTRFFATIPYTTTFTLQICTDAIQDNQHDPSSAHIYPFTSGDSDFALSTYNTKLYFRTQGAGAVSDLGISIDKTKPWGCVTATLDDATKTAAIFSGANSSGGARKTYDTMARPTISSLTLGGGGSDSSHYLIGTLNYFRYYDRVLSDDELRQNREVDVARYSGALSTTNVLVVAGGGTQAETGAYKVEGEWTFTATTMVNRRGETVPVERYSIETLVDGAWTSKRTYKGSSYTYTEGSSPATVRLKWLGIADGIVVIVQ